LKKQTGLCATSQLGILDPFIFVVQFSRMCGRYRRTTSEEELARLYHIPIPKQTDLPISYNIVPSQKVLTIRLNTEAAIRDQRVSVRYAKEDISRVCASNDGAKR
jgi:hypothetical protein